MKRPARSETTIIRQAAAFSSKKGQRHKGWTAVAAQLDKEHRGQVIANPREMILARFMPGQSPSAPCRKLLALLLHRAGTAWENNEWPEDNTFKLIKAELQVSSHQSTDRLPDVLNELQRLSMRSDKIFIEGEGGRAWWTLVPEIKIADRDDPAAPVHLTVSKRLKALMELQHEPYARLNLPILLALESKYAPSLYALGQLIVNMEKGQFMEFRLDDLRERMGIAKNEYERPNDLLRLMERTCAEVSDLCPVFSMYADAVRARPSLRGGLATSGRSGKITAIKIYAIARDPVEMEAKLKRLEKSRIGARARREGTAEEVVGAEAQIAATTTPSRRLARMERLLPDLTAEAKRDREQLEVSRTLRVREARLAQQRSTIRIDEQRTLSIDNLMDRLIAGKTAEDES